MGSTILGIAVALLCLLLGIYLFRSASDEHRQNREVFGRRASGVLAFNQRTTGLVFIALAVGLAVVAIR